MTSAEMAKHARHGYALMQIDEILPEEVYEIYVKEDFNTASWRFYNGKHQIVIGTGIFNEMPSQTDKRQKIQYLNSFLDHELAHSVWTAKELNKIDAILKEKKFSFGLFNLFEDARIEENMRQRTKKQFNWLAYETIKTPENPLETFFFIVQSERSKEKLLELTKSLDVLARDEFNVVYGFYKNILACESSYEVINVMRNWYDKFPQTQRYVEAIEYVGYHFIEESKYLMDDDKFDALLVGAKEILSHGGATDDNVRHSSRSLRSRASSRESLLNSTSVSVAYSMMERNALLREMEKLFLSPAKTRSTAIPSKRLNLKRLATSSEKLFKRKDQERLVKKKITLILDLSSSMRSSIANMRLLIDVMDKMASKNIIDATLILTGVKFGEARHELLNMPLEDGTLQRLVPNFGAEGLDNAMRENLQLLSQSDFNWILTDGYIDEKPLDKSFFNNHNVKTHAMYVGNTSCKGQMRKSFDYVVCEANVMDLAQKIFTLIK